MATKQAPKKTRATDPAPRKATKAPSGVKRGAPRIRLAIEAIRRTWANPKARAAAGVVVLFAGVYVLGALISGLFTGAADYLAVSESADMDRVGYRNWLGGAGAHLAFALGREGLGMGALALPVWFFLVGWRWLTGKPVARQGLVFRFSLLGLVVLPWSAGFIAHMGGWIGVPAWDQIGRAHV